MGLNITGIEVASGAHDPVNMFVIVGVLVVIGFIAYGIYYLCSLK